MSSREVEERLDLDQLIDALAAAHADLSAGRVSMPTRIAAMVDEREGMLAAMPVYLPSAGVLTTKLVTLFPGNAGSPLPTHQAVIAAFDPATGEPLALLDGTAITAIRTGAASALSVRLLARPDAQTLALLGSGVQARSHARAIARVRRLSEIRVASRNRERAAGLADELATELGVPARACAGYEDAVCDADLVAATTHSAEPVVHREWLAPGTHVTSVGVNPNGREVAGEVVRDALVVVESRSAALAAFPAGSNDLLWAIRDGLIDEGHVHAELGELVDGSARGRGDGDQLTLYKSVGVAVQDAAAVSLVLGGLEALSATTVDLGGSEH
ncbi:MAG TPA: ornithine cyclodeaminase family protein [Gaiellales bacterium]|nr:ornithine cyclodeaminase family protein [Gaiellales bacterium]